MESARSPLAHNGSEFLMITRVSLLALLALTPLAAHGASDQTFTRTIALPGHPNLAILSGAGNIQISAGPPGQVRITGHVKANDWHATDDRLRDIASIPPIHQDLNVIRIGVAQDPPHIIIDYEIEAPPNSIIQATSGIGDIIDDGVGKSATFLTAAGSIHATGMLGSVDAGSKSGDIEIEQFEISKSGIAEFGPGDVKATSVSGNLDLRNLRGALRAQTGEGKIAISGAPYADWSLQSGKGDIDLTLGRAACNLDAQSTSGPVLSDLRVDAETTSDTHHLAGKIHGGGPAITVQAAEGAIRIH
jgi:Putative adhesin